MKECKIWAVLLIAGSLILGGAGFLYAISSIIETRVEAIEIENSRDDVVTSEILRRLVRIENKIDEMR